MLRFRVQKLLNELAVGWIEGNLGMLAAMPAATEAAQGAIASLSAQYNELALSIGNARAQAAAFAQTLSQ